MFIVTARKPITAGPEKGREVYFPHLKSLPAFSALKGMTDNASFKPKLFYYNSIFINSLYCSGIAFRNRLNIRKFASGTGDVAFQIIRVDVTPKTRVVVDQLNLCLLTMELYNIPGHLFHCLGAFTGHSLLHLAFNNQLCVNQVDMTASPNQEKSSIA